MIRLVWLIWLLVSVGCEGERNKFLGTRKGGDVDILSSIYSFLGRFTGVTQSGKGVEKTHVSKIKKNDGSTRDDGVLSSLKTLSTQHEVRTNFEERAASPIEKNATSLVDEEVTGHATINPHNVSDDLEHNTTKRVNATAHERDDMWEKKFRGKKRPSQTKRTIAATGTDTSASTVDEEKKDDLARLEAPDPITGSPGEEGFVRKHRHRHRPSAFIAAMNEAVSESSLAEEDDDFTSKNEDDATVKKTLIRRSNDHITMEGSDFDSEELPSPDAPADIVTPLQSPDKVVQDEIDQEISRENLENSVITLLEGGSSGVSVQDSRHSGFNWEDSMKHSMSTGGSIDADDEIVNLVWDSSSHHNAVLAKVMLVIIAMTLILGSFSYLALRGELDTFMTRIQDMNRSSDTNGKETDVFSLYNNESSMKDSKKTDDSTVVTASSVFASFFPRKRAKVVTGSLENSSISGTKLDHSEGDDTPSRRQRRKNTGSTSPIFGSFQDTFTKEDTLVSRQCEQSTEMNPLTNLMRNMRVTKADDITSMLATRSYDCLLTAPLAQNRGRMCRIEGEIVLVRAGPSLDVAPGDFQTKMSPDSALRDRRWETPLSSSKKSRDYRTPIARSALKSPDRSPEYVDEHEKIQETGIQKTQSTMFSTPASTWRRLFPRADNGADLVEAPFSQRLCVYYQATVRDKSASFDAAAPLIAAHRNFIGKSRSSQTRSSSHERLSFGVRLRGDPNGTVIRLNGSSIRLFHMQDKFLEILGCSFVSSASSPQKRGGVALSMFAPPMSATGIAPPVSKTLQAKTVERFLLRHSISSSSSGPLGGYFQHGDCILPNHSDFSSSPIKSSISMVVNRTNRATPHDENDNGGEYVSSVSDDEVVSSSTRKQGNRTDLRNRSQNDAESQGSQSLGSRVGDRDLLCSEASLTLGTTVTAIGEIALMEDGLLELCPSNGSYAGTNGLVRDEFDMDGYSDSESSETDSPGLSPSASPWSRNIRRELHGNFENVPLDDSPEHKQFTSWECSNTEPTLSHVFISDSPNYLTKDNSNWFSWLQ